MVIYIAYNLAEMEDIFDFTNQCNDWNNFWPHHCVGNTWKPYGRYQNHESAYIISKIISIYYLTLVQKAVILDVYVLRQHLVKIQ